MFKKISLGLLVLTLSACASIPPEAPALSVKLGNQITNIEKANLTLLRRYFDQKRADVDEFIEERWLPHFAEKYFSNNEVREQWDKVIKKGSAYDRAMLAIIDGTILQTEINTVRTSMMTQVDALEREVEQKIREEYNLARSINNSLTSFLTSAADVSKSQDRYLAMMGADKTTMDKLINDTDAVVSRLVDDASTFENRAEKAQEFIDGIKELRSEVQG